MIAMILTILVSMLVYIFWFMKSEFQRVLDRIDQSTLGMARMQRELTQSTVQQLNDQLQESFGRLDEEEYDGEEEDEEEDEEEEGEGDEQEEEDEQETQDTALEEIDEVTDEGDEDQQENFEDTPAGKAVEKQIETAIEELDAAIAESPPKKRGRKPKK